jgi:hypothetical protein
MRRSFLLTAVLAACGSGEIARQHVQLGSLTFDVPADWQRGDTTRRGIATAIWSPGDNERKETITVTRSELVPATAAAGPALLEQLLARASQLPDAHRSETKQVTTQQGLQGARVELDYTPPNSRLRYHRVHVVLADGDALVHVLYTALDPDRDLDALRLVLATIRHGEAS